MKPVLQAVLFLGLVTPSFSAAPEVDFDGANKTHKSVPAYITEALQDSSIGLLENKVDGIPSRRLVEIKESGKEETILPVKTADGKDSYEYMPNANTYWDFSCTGQVAGQWKVCWSTDFRPGVAGHNHSPTGTLSYIDPQSTTTPPALLPKEICRTSQVNTPIRIYYKAPVYSTFVYDKANFTGKCTGSMNDEVSIKVTAQNVIQLAELVKEPYFNFKESPDQQFHPGNFYATPDTNSKMKQIAWEYYQQYNERLTINDMGLIWGGRYHTFSPYNCWVDGKYHTYHRYGRQVDVRSSTVDTQPKRNCLKELACIYQVDPILEGKAPGSLLGRNVSMLSESELDALDRDEHYHFNFARATDSPVNPRDDNRKECSSYLPPEVSACPKPYSVK